jgi:hypothetical protein
MQNAMMASRLPAGLDARGEYESSLYQVLEKRRAAARAVLEANERQTRDLLKNVTVVNVAGDLW